MSRTMAVTSTDAERGVKRRADDALEDEQRFAKRFNLLNLADKNGSKLYIPIDNKAPIRCSTTRPNDASQSQSYAEEHMSIDDTPHRVYVHDLEEEFASTLEDDSNQLIFLTDIDRSIGKIPLHILRGDTRDNQGKELVLYDQPASNSVPEEQDIVRRAIIETKRRKAKEMTAGYRRPDHEGDGVETAHGYTQGEYQVQDKAVHAIGSDVDAMDMG